VSFDSAYLKIYYDKLLTTLHIDVLIYRTLKPTT